MIDLLKKTVLTGVGMTLLTKDKVEELARDVASAAQMSAEKGQAFVDEAVARAERGRTDLEQTVKRIVQDTLKSLDLPTRADIARLDERLAALEKRLAQ